MDAPLAAVPEWLDAAAVALGAGSAAVVADRFRSKRLDWLGVVVIGTAAALGGGVVRDLLLGLRPAATSSEWHLLVAAIASIAGMLLQAAFAKRDAAVALLDALALGFFCAIGTAKAWQAGAPPVPAIFIGTCTAVGGGIIRDLLVGMPVGVLYVGSFYAFAAMSGAGAFLAAAALGADPIWAMVVCGAVTFAIRMASLWFGLSLPEQIALQWPRRLRARAGGGEIERRLTDAEFVEAAGLHPADTRPIDLIRAKPRGARGEPEAR